jgi:hypothetical protein
MHQYCQGELTAMKMDTTKISEASAVQPTCICCHPAETILILPDLAVSRLIVKNYRTD